MQDKKTALYEVHTALKAKMVPFAGYIMPIQYSGIMDEHRAVRNSVGVFDVSHMGEFIVKGKGAEGFLNQLTTNNVARLAVGQIQYSTMLYEDGGVVDDLLVYRFEDHYMMVVNASNINKDFDWAKSHLDNDVELNDVSDEYTLLAVQGPDSKSVVSKLTEENLDDLVYYTFKVGKIAGKECIISRTGYTGEDGFELYISRADSEHIWNAVFESGEEFGIKPIGLAARDSLRLELSYCLYGNDIDQTTNPIEAGLGWIVKSKKKGGFIGKAQVLSVKENPFRKLVGFKLKAKGIARQHCEIYFEGKKVGEVTSGGMSPMLEIGIGMGYIDIPYNALGTNIKVDVRGRRISAEVVKTPFYTPPADN
jgi:aminomethyltransferase